MLTGVASSYRCQATTNTYVGQVSRTLYTRYHIPYLFRASVVRNMVSPLLALPRELRDNIYSYLHEDINFKDGHGYTARLQNSIVVTIKDAPLPQLFAVSQQLRREYTDAIDCSAHIATDTLGTINQRARRTIL